MVKTMRILTISLGMLILFACGLSDTGINKSLNVADGETRSGGLRTVNGSIHVGNEAKVLGDCSTVNGRVSVGQHAEVGEISCVNGSVSVDRESQVEEISCVNGSIDLDGDVVVKGDVGTVNGSIQVKHRVHIHGDMSTVNGGMEAVESLIGGDVTTVNGNIDLLDASKVKGNVIVDRHQKKPMGGFKELTILVQGGSQVRGNIEVKGDDPNVKVVLADGGEVLGEIINAKIVRK